MSARDRRTPRPGRGGKDEPAEEEAPPPPAAPLSPEEAKRAFKERMTALVLAQEEALAKLGGRRDLLPPAPKPEDFARFQAKQALAPPRELSDEELGLGELGIPERRIKAVGAAWNFTIGPTFVYQGPASIAEIQKKLDPVILVARYIPDEEYKKIDRTRVRGVIVEEGSIADPLYWLLRDENRASVVAAKGALELAVNEELCIVDGVRGVAYFGPCAKTVEDYTHLRTLGPPPEDPLLKETFRQLATAVMGSRFRDQKIPPFEFPEYERLTDIARRARKGLPITKEDDDWMKSIILQGFPTPEEMMAKAKKPTALKDEPAEALRGAAKEKDAAPAARGEKSASEGGEKGGEEAAGDEAPKSAAESRKAQREAEIAAARAARGGEKKEEKPSAAEEPAPKPEPAKPEPKAEARSERAKPAPEPEPVPEPPKKEDAATSRKAQREAEIAAARAARGKDKEKDKKDDAAKPAEEPKPDESKDGGAEEPFDPLADMV